MKRIAISLGVVAAMLFVASSSVSAAGLTLAWNACASDGGVSNKNVACTSNAGSSVVVGTFQVDAAIPGVTGVEIVLDLISATNPLPTWWDFQPTLCRAGGISMTGALSPLAVNCLDWAQTQGLGGLAAYNRNGTIAPADTAAHRRVVGGIATGSPGGFQVDPATDYFAFNMAISNAKTVGTGACAGCLTPVCIVLNSINVVPGVLAGTKLVDGVTPGSNWVTWQGGAGASCAAVPTRNATWGQVKSLYR